MTNFYKIAFILIGLSSFTTTFSQSFEHRNFKYDWTDELRITLVQEEKYKDYEAVILHEETTLDIDLKNIKRYQVFQFNTEAAIDEYNMFRVPIPMDPRLATIENVYRKDTTSFPHLLYERINFFDARIIRNGEFVKAVLDELAYRREERTGEYMVPYYVHYFYVRNLQPGDQLEVIISHQWPKFTYKYYLNEKLPKQEVYINVNNSELGEFQVYANSQLAKFISNETTKNHSAYKVVFEDLNPVDPLIPTYINDLPRVEFFENKTYESSTQFFGKSTIDTVSWRDFLYRLVTRIDPGESRTWENYDAQSYKTSLFYTKMQELSGNNLSGAELMNFIHIYAVESLEYKNDFNYFIHTESGFTDLGSFLDKKILREASRHEFYFKMLDRIDQPYYKVFLQDRRFKIIDTSTANQLYDDHLAYMMFSKDSTPYLFYPKRGRFGYYANELPFYLTEQYAHLIPQTVPRKIYDYEAYLIQYPLFYFPNNAMANNHKKHTSIVKINLANKTSSYESSILLSGQFSTMTRGYYQYGYIDTTISPTYYTDIFKKIPDTKIKQGSAQKTFPFTHGFNISASGYANVFSTVDGSYTIDLSGLINIHYQNLVPKFFSCHFKHDFSGKEEYIIELNFDQLVEIEDFETYNTEINVEGLLFSSSLVKIADNQYGLKLVWEIWEDYTSSEHITDLEACFKAIKKMNELKLKVKVQ